MPSPSSSPSALTPGLSIVVPVYRSEQSLPALVARLEPVLRASGSAFELILVNDGSPDASHLVMAELSRTHSWVRGITLMRNYGQHNALLAGIRAARHELTLTMDDDLQHPPEEIPRLREALTANFDVVYGYPEKQTHGLLRDLASAVTKLTLQKAVGAETARSISAFRLFRTSVRDAFANYHHPFVNIDVLLTWGSARFTSLKVRHDPRAHGESAYTLGKLINHTTNMLTGFSVLPLQAASVIGFAFTLFGMLILLFVVGRYFIAGTSMPGFPFLASVIAIFSGAQLFALGIIGEYLARMHFRSMNKPAYAIREPSSPDA